METVEYILDFFFNNGWHYLLLFLLFMALGHKGTYITNESQYYGEDEE